MLVLKLLLCGDIESNPGPEVTLKTIFDGQAAILTAIDELKLQLGATNTALAAISATVSEVDRRMNEMTQATCKIDGLGTSLGLIRSSINQQSGKLVDLEDRSRRSNLIVYGIPEAADENESILKEKVVNGVFEKKLKVSCKSVGRIHRLGRGGGNRPTILYLQDFNEKQLILKNAKKLKGTNIFISNDYSQRTLRRRKLLWESAKTDKNNGKNVYLIHDKLHIDDDTFVWNEDKNERVKVSPTRKVPAVETLPTESATESA